MNFLEYNGVRVYSSIYIPNEIRTKRTLFNRLFSRPWKPFKIYNYSENNKVYMAGEIGFCSYRAYELLHKKLEVPNE